MKRPILLSILTAALVIGSTIPSLAQSGIDPNQPDTLIVDSTVAYVSGVGVIPIVFVNDEELSAIEVTLEHNSPEIVIDSFSFAGSRVDLGITTNGFMVSDDSTTITIFCLASGSTLVPTGKGLLGKLYVSYAETISPQLIPFDTVTWIDGFIQYSTTFKGENMLSLPFIPQCISGYLDIQAAPSTMDSLWLDTLDATPGEQIAMNIYAYNERELDSVAIALDYGSSTVLHLDSVSYEGTRSQIASYKGVQHWTGDHKLYAVFKFDITPLPSDIGILATIHFTVDSTSPETIINIDTTTVGIDWTTEFTLTDNDGGTSFTPIFTPGWVDIKVSTAIEDITPERSLPTSFELAQNYPNPFNPSTSIELSLPQAGHVTLDVFNVLGQKVRRLIDQCLSAGVHRVVFDGRTSWGSQLATGVYFYRLQSDDFSETKKMLLLK
ncbi:MAG: hypothetical protein DRP45_09250 [Candidatus Zixiibacteriota bacterium]|nr:MAG: hypothetical protein DRP45_09250 [candidate division Zixibacteria bacterium]